MRARSCLSTVIVVGLATVAINSEGAMRPAHALSQDCATFSINATIGIGDSASSQYTLEAGETITFNVVLAMGTTIDIIGFGETRSLSQSGSVSITIPNTGPISSGSFIFRVSSTDLNTRVQISATCAGAVAPPPPPPNAAIDANAVANVVDDAVDSALPGGNDGSVIDDFGLSVSAALFNREGLVLATLRNTLEIRQLRDALFRELGSLEDAISGLRSSIERAGPAGPFIDADRRAQFELESARNTLRTASQNLDATLERLSIAVGDPTFSGATEDVGAAQAAVNAARQGVQSAEVLAQAAANDLVAARDAAAGSGPTPEQQAILRDLALAEQRLAEVRNRINTIAQLGGEGPIFRYVQDGSNRDAGTAVPQVLRGGVDGLSGRVDLRDWRRQRAAQRFASSFEQVRTATTGQIPRRMSEPRFNAWVQGDVTFHHVDANNRDEDGFTAAVAGGVSYRFARRWEAGLVGRIAHSERDGRVAETDLDIWSVGTFVQGIVGDGVLIQGIAVASFGDGDTVLDPRNTRPTGDFDIEAYQVQAKASRRFLSGRWWFEPNASLTLSHVIRDGFTASNGTVVPRTRSTRATMSLGPTIGTAIPMDGAILTPYLGADAFLTAVDQPDRVTPIDSGSSTLGITGRGGFGLTFENGGTVSLDGRFTVHGENAVDASISGQIRIPFGR